MSCICRRYDISYRDVLYRGQKNKLMGRFPCVRDGLACAPSWSNQTATSGGKPLSGGFSLRDGHIASAPSKDRARCNRHSLVNSVQDCDCSGHNPGETARSGRHHASTAEVIWSSPLRWFRVGAVSSCSVVIEPAMKLLEVEGRDVYDLSDVEDFAKEARAYLKQHPALKPPQSGPGP
jgi:hypothetical protein